MQGSMGTALQLFSTAAKVEEARAITPYQEIEQLLQRAIDANPTDFIAFFNLGWIKRNIYGDLGTLLFEKASLLSFELNQASVVPQSPLFGTTSAKKI